MIKTVVLPLVHLTEKMRSQGECSLSYDRVVSYPGEALCSIEAYNSEMGKKQFSSTDIFGCLCELRRFLESEKWRILCNGARLDAYPSTMSRQMGGGQKLYILKIGEQPTKKDLVKIFDQADLDKIGTVEEQFSYYQQWVESIS